MNSLKRHKPFRTYRLQMVVFFSFLGLFTFIVAGILLYGYHSNSMVILNLSDELLFQISQTIIRQTINHLEPAQKTGLLFKSLLESENFFGSSPELIEQLSREALKTYPQFSALYFGDEAGNFLMTQRVGESGYSTRVISRTGSVIGTFETDRDEHWNIIASSTSSNIGFDPRSRPWYALTKSEKKMVWSHEYSRFASQAPGITCAHPVFGFDGSFIGAVGIDFRIGELSEFLSNLKIGDSGIAFIADEECNILAYPEKSGIEPDNIRAPRSPMKTDIETGWAKNVIDRYMKDKTPKFTFYHDDKLTIAFFATFQKKFGKNWVLGILVPEDDFIDPVVRIHETTLMFSFWLLIVAGFLTSALAKKLASPIDTLTQEAKKIQSLDLEGEITINSPIREIQAMSDTMSTMKQALSSFKKYVPIEVVQNLVYNSNEAKIESQVEELTIMFTDIEGFSAIAEKEIPSELSQQLAEYFDAIADIIHKNGGTIDKFIGDSVMAFWRSGEKNKNHAAAACMAAIEITEAVACMNDKWRGQNRHEFKTRIGINTGSALVGNFGSTGRFNYTVIGDNVNLANRLEGLNKTYKTSIMASESTAKAAERLFFWRPIDYVSVKGRQGSLRIYELMALRTHPNKEIYENVAKLSERALRLYLNRKWKQAYEVYQSIFDYLPEDKIAELYLGRCRELYENPPSADWSGVFHFTVK